MSSITDLKSRDVKLIILTLIVGSLAFYLAIVFAEAVQKTVDSWIPNNDGNLYRLWINVGIALLIIIVAVFVIVKCFV